MSFALAKFFLPFKNGISVFMICEPDYLESEGVTLLNNLLQYAKTKGAIFADTKIEHESPFEEFFIKNGFTIVIGIPLNDQRIQLLMSKKL